MYEKEKRTTLCLHVCLIHLAGSYFFLHPFRFNSINVMSDAFTLCLYSSETAINIGYSCKLLTDEMEDIYVVDGDNYETVENQLQKAYGEMTRISKDGANSEVISYSNALPNSDHQAPELCGGFALILNGHSLVSLQTNPVEIKRLEVEL